jgi:hypothetical protein
MGLYRGFHHYPYPHKRKMPERSVSAFSQRPALVINFYWISQMETVTTSTTATTATTNDNRRWLLDTVAKILNVYVWEKPELNRSGECIELFSAFRVNLKSLSDIRCYAHELTHVLQHVFNSFKFSSPEELEAWLETKGLSLDESFCDDFAILWQEFVSSGSYIPEDYSSEFVAFYVTYATNGFKVFTSMVKESGCLNPPPGGFIYGEVYPLP